jgi:hypothetical protein
MRERNEMTDWQEEREKKTESEQRVRKRKRKLCTRKRDDTVIEQVHS